MGSGYHTGYRHNPDGLFARPCAGYVSSGQTVTTGTPLGVASCEGGRSTSSHLHLARRYNGEWVAADGPVPLILSDWQVRGAVGEYNGDLIREAEVKTACECWSDDNAVTNE